MHLTHQIEVHLGKENMLSQRQIEILLEYCNHPGEFYTASAFAERMNVSLRTIQGDMKEIRAELEGESCMELLSKTAKGSTIVVKDNDEFSAYVNALYQQMTTVSLTYPVSRITKLLLLLLHAHRAIRFSYIEEKFFISRSTLLNDLKKAEEILEKFQLVLLKGGNRIMLDGMEFNKRRCLQDQDLYLAHAKNEQGILYVDERQIAKIKNVVTDCFVDHKYHIMDTDFNNLVLYINIMLLRVGDGFYIQPNELQQVVCEGADYELAADLCERLGHRFFLLLTEKEISYITIYLRSIGNNQDEGTIPPEMDEFIIDALGKLEKRFGFPFEDNMTLRITLALHTMSLAIRIRYDMQMKNDMLEYIRTTFPLGYEIASYYGYILSQKYGKRVTEDEVALLAVHFYSTLMEENLKKDKAQVLVFTNMKNSMSVLLKQTILRWFSDDIAGIDFVSEIDLDPDILDDYDIFLTTEKGQMYENNLAMFINPFPEKKDYFNLKLNIDGFKDIEDVIDIFKPELFDSVRQIKKTDALERLCDKSSRYYELEGLEEEVFKREEIGSTFFTKDIAMAHPATPVSSDTFISVLISKKAITWDADENMVNLVMLMHIGKSNPRAFQLWEYMAKIFSDKSMVDQLTLNPTYENFISLVTASLQKNLNAE